MSLRFPDDGTLKSDGIGGKTPDTTLSCLMCKAQMQDARIVPGCLHTYCKSCLDRHSNGQPSFSCPQPTCSQVINQPVESLPANSYFTSLAALDENEAEKLFLINSVKSRDSQQSSALSGVNNKNGIIPSGLGTFPSSTQYPGGELPPGSNLGAQQRYNQLTSDIQEIRWKSTDPSWAKPNMVLPNFESLNFNNAWKTADPWTGETSLLDPPGNLMPVAATVNGSPVSMPQQKCAACDENHVVTAHCRDCKEDMCESCVIAHQRVKITREHAIFHYPEPTGNTATTPGRPTFTTPHSANDSDVMRVYQETVDKSRLENKRLCEEAKEGIILCDTALHGIGVREREIAAKRDVVSRSVQKMIDMVVLNLRERESYLLDRINTISQVKFKSLEEQQQDIRKMNLILREISNSLEDNSMTDRMAIENNKKFTQIMDNIRHEMRSLDPKEDDFIDFIGPDENFRSVLARLGFVSSSGFYKNCQAEGDGLLKGVLGRTCRFMVMFRDHLGEPCTLRHDVDVPKIMIRSPDNHKVWMNMGEGNNGQYPVQWRPHVEGEHRIDIKLNTVSIPGSPFICTIRDGRDYNKIGEPVLVFGKEGEADGEFCRPWGVCCTKDGRIVVADRSNNRVQLFLANGSFYFKFGTEGRGNGQFNKPASVACDSRNRLIVTDKDNHRIQIFTNEGVFINKFGEKGSEHGRFNYPWDVACNSRDQILVSDTRNHRLQLFSPTGEFLTMYGFDSSNWKNFDSPRGVCFSAEDQVLVTDFNLHRLLVIRANFENAQFLGKQGTENGEFTRPNGVTVDDEGNIIVADSRNHRIQIFSSSGTFIKKFGVKGTLPGQLDTPQGICMTPDGKIVVVDSLHRVQIF